MTVAMLRALPAGLLLVMIVRQIPTGIWWMRIFILGALNISLFWSLLFISVYRLPGGVAATVGAVQPLMVVFISAALLGRGQFGYRKLLYVKLIFYHFWFFWKRNILDVKTVMRGH